MSGLEVLRLSNAAQTALSGEAQSTFAFPFDKDSSDSIDRASMKNALRLYLRGTQMGLRDAKRPIRKVFSW